MWVIQISGVDKSYHTQQCDANDQKTRFIADGISETDIVVVEKDTFGS